MIHLRGRIRDYNASAETCSIEPEGLGVIDARIDGSSFYPDINRSLNCHGNRCTVSVHDEHRPDEATLSGSSRPCWRLEPRC